jgi:ABC-type Mn2+/Zn2+ transport system permease subunit
MMALSAIIGALSSLIGLYLSYYADIPSGAAIVLAATFIFLLAFFFSPRQGFLARLRSLQRTEP